MEPFDTAQFNPDGLGEAGPQAYPTTNGHGPEGAADLDMPGVRVTASRVAELEAELAALKGGVEATTPLYGSERFKPAVYLQKELPHHRQICQLFAKGHTPSEVAQMTGFTNVTVNDVRKQPWALKYIAELMEKMGRKAVQSELQGATLEAARTMIRVMKGEVPGTKPCDMIKSAKEILDRQYGTAPANLPMDKVDLNDVSDEELVQTMRGQNN